MATELGYFDNLDAPAPDGLFVVVRAGLWRVEAAPRGGCPKAISRVLVDALADNGLGGDMHRQRERAHQAADWLNAQSKAGALAGVPLTSFDER